MKANRDVTRDDSQRRFLAQHSIVMLEQRWNQHALHLLHAAPCLQNMYFKPLYPFFVSYS